MSVWKQVVISLALIAVFILVMHYAEQHNKQEKIDYWQKIQDDSKRNTQDMETEMRRMSDSIYYDSKRRARERLIDSLAAHR